MEPTGRALAGFVNPSQQKVEDDSEGEGAVATLSGREVQKNRVETGVNVPYLPRNEASDKTPYFEAGYEKQQNSGESRRKKKNRRKKDNNKKVSVAAASGVSVRAEDLLRRGGHASTEVRKSIGFGEPQCIPSRNDLQDVIGKQQQVTQIAWKVPVIAPSGEPDGEDDRFSHGTGDFRDESQFTSLPRTMPLPTSNSVTTSEEKLQPPYGTRPQLAAAADLIWPDCEDQTPKGAPITNETTPDALEYIDDEDGWETVSAGPTKKRPYTKIVTAKNVPGKSSADPGVDDKLQLLSAPLQSISREDYEKCAGFYNKDPRRLSRVVTYEKFRQLVATPLPNLRKDEELFLLKIFRRLLRNVNYSEAVLANALYLNRQHYNFIYQMSHYYPSALRKLLIEPRDPDYQVPDVIMDYLIVMLRQQMDDGSYDVLGWETMNDADKACLFVCFAIMLKKKQAHQLLEKLLTKWVPKATIKQWIDKIQLVEDMVLIERKVDIRSLLPSLTNGIFRWISIRIRYTPEEERLKWVNFFIKTKRKVEASLEKLDARTKQMHESKTYARKNILWNEVKCYRLIINSLPYNEILGYLTGFLSYVRRKDLEFSHSQKIEGFILRQLCFNRANYLEYEITKEKSTCTGEELNESYSAYKVYRQELQELASKEKTRNTVTKLNQHETNDLFSDYTTIMLESKEERLGCMLNPDTQEKARDIFQSSVEKLRSLDQGKDMPDGDYFIETVTLEIAKWFFISNEYKESTRELVGLDFSTPEQALKKAELLSKMAEWKLALNEYNRILKFSNLPPKLTIKATNKIVMVLLTKFMNEKSPERDNSDLLEAYQIITGALTDFPEDESCESTLIHVIELMDKVKIDFHSNKLGLPEQFNGCRSWQQVGQILHIRHKSASSDISVQAAKEASKTRYC